MTEFMWVNFNYRLCGSFHAWQSVHPHEILKIHQQQYEFVIYTSSQSGNEGW